MSTTSPEFVYTPQPDSAEIAAKIISLLSITVLAILFGIKTHNVQFKYLSYSRWLVLTLYLLSWSFTAISMVLVTTNNANFTSCFLSIMVCDVFYSGTKLVIYAWLIEKVYIVSYTRQTRWKTISYRIHVLLLVPYVAILSLMLAFHTADLEASGVCIIGLQSIAAIPLIAYDFAFNLYMTILFVRPLLKLGKSDVSDRRRPRLRQVALRTLVASVVCLVVSFANIFSLQMFHGRERGLVCLTCCTVDVTINVITIHWVTSQNVSRKTKNNSQSDYSSNQLRHDSILEFTSHRSLENQPRLAMATIDHQDGTVKTQLPRADSKLAGLNKYDDQTSENDDNFFCISSSHASQNSRKSLNK